jgi:hypothetical protein
MSSFLERYRAGECEAVWQTLVASGDAVQREPLRSQAWAVAQELVSRTIGNLRIIHAFLVELGYEFREPDNVITLATDQTLDGLAEIEHQLGQVPMVLRAWWNHIDKVDFSQSEQQRQSEVGPHSDGLVPNPSLHILPPEKSLELSTERAVRTKEHNESVAEALAADPSLREMVQFSELDERFLALGPCASNNDLKGFHLPCSGIDDRYYNAGGGDVSFVADLRLTFAMGGLSFVYIGPRTSVAITPKQRREEIIAALVPKLMPI